MTDNPIPSLRRKALKDFKAAPIRVSPSELVQTRTLDGSPLPLVIEPAVEGIDFSSWMRANEKAVREKLRLHGAVLFRGFGLNTPEYFQRVISAFSSQLMEYNERSTPRTKVDGSVYTSTEYPADQPICLHNENSYSHIWPTKISFLCLRPPESGGETPIADSRKILKLLDPQIVQRFIEKKVMYVRNFRAGLGVSWQEAFQTSERASVERYCRDSGIEFEWLGPNHLRTRQIRPALAEHPETGETVWFNQAHLFHFSSLNEKVLRSIHAVYREEEFPRSAYYGDGSTITLETVAAIHQAFNEAAVLFPWKQGDMLLLDNMLSAHGRRPYIGERKVVVVMAEPLKQGPAI